MKARIRKLGDGSWTSILDILLISGEGGTDGRTILGARILDCSQKGNEKTYHAHAQG